MKLKTLVLLLSLLFVVAKSFSQDFDFGQSHFRIRYVINRPEVDTTFVDNSARISEIEDFLQMAHDDSTLHITSVKFKGTASPDGAYDFNVWLSENRLRTFKELIGKYLTIPDSIIHANVSDIPWDGFRDKVAESNLKWRDEILAIIDEGPSLVPWFNNRRIDPRLLKLKRLYRGELWDSLKSPILRDLRYGDAVFTYYRLQPMEPLAVNAIKADLPQMVAPLPDVWSWVPRLHLKTSLIGLALLNANFAVEADLAPHWSATLPIYYCAIDWFKSTIKFRNLSIYPEVRYWFRNWDNDGFFVGAHFGLSYYNYAFDGKLRYQDHRGRTPAIGGGLSAGYRMPISKNHRWRMEFTLGAGVYPLDYDLFDNTPDVKDGQLMDRKKETSIGLDQVAVTVAYSFDMNRYRRVFVKKGGGK